MKYTIALLADGIGPEVLMKPLKFLMLLQKNSRNHWTPALTGACAIDAVGVPYPDETHEICMKADAVLFGAIGHPKYDNDQQQR
jgi:3-isopropylmalate dehydrogenase